MRQLPLLLALSTLGGCASLPEQPAAREATPDAVATLCATVQCVHDLRVELKREDGSMFSKVYEAMPVVQPAGVSVYAGSTVHIEADIADGRLVNLRRVDDVVDPARTITSKLEQDAEGGMLLVTSNPFDRPLKIRMGMMPLARGTLVATSSCPVVAGGSSFEMWPFPIFQIMLADMRLMDADAPMACVE